MPKKIAILLTGLSLSVSSMGCCCLSGLGGNRCQPCNSGCPTGGYQQTGMIQSLDQTAYAGGISQSAAFNGATIGTPIMASPGGYTQTVLVPANSLPSYH